MEQEEKGVKIFQRKFIHTMTNLIVLWGFKKEKK